MATSLSVVAEALQGKAINIIKYGYKNNGLAAAIFYDIDTLNGDNIDWKKIKPKQVEIKSQVVMEGGKKGMVTWQEVDLKDQVMSVKVITDATHITLNVVGPLTFKRGESFFSKEIRKSVTITEDAAAADGATELALVVTDTTDLTVNDTARLTGYAKGYAANEGNTFNQDRYVELENYFQRTNMEIIFDQSEVNVYRLIFGDKVRDYVKQKLTEASRKMLRGIMRDFYTKDKAAHSINGKIAYQAGGLDYFITQESGVAGIALDSTNTPRDGEILIGGTDYEEKRKNFETAIRKVGRNGLPNSKRKLMYFATESFLAELTEMYIDRLRHNDSLKSISLDVQTLEAFGFKVNFAQDDILDDLFLDSDGEIEKVCYSVPMNYIMMYMLPNDVPTGGALMPGSMGQGKIFVPPVTSEEESSVRLYTVFSYAFGGIKSGGYRTLVMDW